MKGKNLSEDRFIFKTEEIAEILGVSTRRVNQMEKEGALKKVGRNQYDIRECFHTYTNAIVEKEKAKDPDKLDKTYEEALWTRRKREKTEVELQILRGDVHRSKDVSLVIGDMLGRFRGKIQSLPSKIAPRLLNKDNISNVKALLEEEMKEVLTELSDYDPHVFYGKSKDKIYINEDEGDGI